MVQNFPGPYELRFSYQTVTGGVTLSHTQRLNIDLTADPNPGDAFNNINAKTRAGIATPDLATVVEAWITLMAYRFHTTTVFGIVELWKYTAQSFDALFISSYNPTANAGLNANPVQGTRQEVFTFRTQEGGILRIQLMEGMFDSNVKEPYPTSAQDVDDIFEFVISTVNWILARDTSYPFSALNHLGSENEKLFRIRHR